MANTHLVIPDPHAHWKHSNERADWLGKLIVDVKPDVVVMMGDGADMPSLASYDKGKRSFHGRTYKADVEAWLDFDDRMWTPLLRQKKRKPRRIALIGNHEQRIERALDIHPELQGAISYDDLGLKENYDEVVYYSGGTPGMVVVDGIAYSHYFITGVAGRATSGEHPAHALLTKQFMSCTQGHTHVLDFSERTNGEGKKIFGMVCGVFQDYDSDWAGEINKLWWRGVVVKRNVENGVYDPQFISLEGLRREYGPR